MAAIFTSSTPETRPDWAQSTGTWRVAHADRLRACTGDGSYVDHDGTTRAGHLRLWVGLRDNRDPQAHSSRLETLGATLRAQGLSVRRVKRSGRTVALRVIDTQPRRP